MPKVQIEVVDFVICTFFIDKSKEQIYYVYMNKYSYIHIIQKQEDLPLKKSRNYPTMRLQRDP